MNVRARCHFIVDCIVDDRLSDVCDLLLEFQEKDPPMVETVDYRWGTYAEPELRFRLVSYEYT